MDTGNGRCFPRRKYRDLECRDFVLVEVCIPFSLWAEREEVVWAVEGFCV